MALQFFLFALLLVSAQTQAKSIDVPTQRDLNEQLNQLLEKFVASLKEFVQAAKSILQSLYDSLAEEAQEALDKALADLKEQIAEFQKEIEAIKEIISQVGDDVRQCVKNEEGEIVDLQDWTRDQLVLCQKTLIDEAKQVLKDTIEKVQSSAELVTGLYNKLQNCGTNIICYMQLIGEIPKAIDEVKGNIAQIVAGFKNFKDENIETYGYCINKALTSSAAQAQFIKGDIEKCIKNIGSS